MKEREVGKEFAVSWSIIVHAFLCAFLSLSLFLSLFLLCMHTLPLLSSQNPKSPHRRFISPFTGISAQSSDPTASLITAPLPNQKKKKKNSNSNPKRSSAQFFFVNNRKIWMKLVSVTVGYGDSKLRSMLFFASWYCRSCWLILLRFWLPASI